MTQIILHKYHIIDSFVRLISYNFAILWCRIFPSIVTLKAKFNGGQRVNSVSYRDEQRSRVVGAIEDPVFEVQPAGSRSFARRYLCKTKSSPRSSRGSPARAIRFLRWIVNGS